MAKFGRALLTLLRSYFVTVGVLVTLLFCLLVLNVAQLDFDEHVEVQHGDAVLVLDVGGQLRNWRTSESRHFWSRWAWGVRDTWLSDVRRVLTVAQADPRIKAVLLDMQETLQGSLVDFAVLRELIASFVANSDKEVVCFLATGDDKSYFLASAADHIVISPVTALEIPGPVLHLTYFGSALKKLGVGVQVVQTGDYKSAFEPFVRDQPSAATLEMYYGLEENLRSYLVSAIAQGRQREEPEVRTWLARSIFTADDAVNRGLVDSIGHRSDALSAAVLKETVPADEQVTYRSYLATAESEHPADGGGLGLIEAMGPIFMDGNEWDTLLPRRIIAELQWMRDNDSVHAIVLRINSPGGSAVASELIWKEVTRLAAHKPVVVSMGEMAASGGYYLAAGASYLLAEPATLTGSIGVVGMIPNLHGFADEYGINFHVVTASERQALYNLNSAMSDTDQRIVQHSLQEVYRIFKERVAEGREMEIKKVAQLAGGRVFTGAQAVEVGLVDALGDLAAAFTKAKDLANLDPTQKYPLYRYDHGHRSFFDCLRATLDIPRCLKARYSRSSSFTSNNLHHYVRLLTSKRTQVLALWPHFINW